MQEKKTKTSWHYRLNLIKSILGIGIGITLMCVQEWYFNVIGGMLVGTEILSTLDEL
jgi:hypothetical protein